LFAVIGLQERETISKRTKDAPPAKKARGAVLGTPANPAPKAIAKSQLVRQEFARTNLHNLQVAHLGAAS
jgi:DNA invertase Pin-like site-specific DNA recombinase